MVTSVFADWAYVLSRFAVERLKGQTKPMGFERKLRLGNRRPVKPQVGVKRVWEAQFERKTAGALVTESGNAALGRMFSFKPLAPRQDEKRWEGVLVLRCVCS